MEDKQKICDLLLPAFQATRELHDLAGLKYDAECELVIAVFGSRYKRVANVAADSGVAMIRDILRQIT